MVLNTKNLKSTTFCRDQNRLLYQPKFIRKRFILLCLGVIIDFKSIFNVHVFYTVNKASSLGFLSWLFLNMLQ